MSLIITANEAATLLQISEPTLRYRALVSKRVKLHRRSPLAFKLTDVLEAAQVLRLPDPRRKSGQPRGRKPAITTLGRFTA